MKNYLKGFVVFLLIQIPLVAQPWVRNDVIFNQSGVPSLMFSHSRFTDLDNDGDFDMVLGNISGKPLYLENIGTPTAPKFIVNNDDIFSLVFEIDAEVGVMADINDDGKLDLITGGFTGVHLYKNAGIPEFPVFAKVEDFFSGIEAGINPVPDLGDVDNDGDLDLVLGFSEDGSVKIFFNGGAKEEAQFHDSQSLLIGDVGLYAYPVFCDMDGDNDLDILVGRDSYGFVYYKNTGTPTQGNWQSDPVPFSGIGYDTYFNSPGVADINGDGKLDLIYGSGSGPLNYFENIGTPQKPTWKRNTTLFGGVIDVNGASNPFFYDYDEDGDYDLFSGSNLGNIKYYENTGNAYSPAWKENSTPFASLKHSIYSAVTLGDVNQDSLPDAIVGDLNGNLYLHLNTGKGFVLQNESFSSISLGGRSVPRLVDMDYDGDLDLVVGNEEGNLFYFENQGSAMSPNWVEIFNYFHAINVSMDCSPTVADFTGDGNMDVLTGNLWHELNFFTRNENNVWIEDTTSFAEIEGDQNVAPALVDLDNDGDLDLVLGCYEGTFSYYENQSVVTGVSEKKMILPQEYTVRNFPNPFNASTTIEFTLPVSTPVRLTIFDISGREIRFWKFLTLQQGIHTITWDGMNQNGEAVSSGVYLYLIQTPSHGKSSTMILLK